MKILVSSITCGNEIFVFSPPLVLSVSYAYSLSEFYQLIEGIPYERRVNFSPPTDDWRSISSYIVASYRYSDSVRKKRWAQFYGLKKFKKTL